MFAGVLWNPRGENTWRVFVKFFSRLPFSQFSPSYPGTHSQRYFLSVYPIRQWALLRQGFKIQQRFWWEEKYKKKILQNQLQWVTTFVQGNISSSIFVYNLYLCGSIYPTRSLFYIFRILNVIRITQFTDNSAIKRRTNVDRNTFALHNASMFTWGIYSNGQIQKHVPPGTGRTLEGETWRVDSHLKKSVIADLDVTLTIPV